ncbi:V-set and immunoglobulin domain-containing protein 1 [Tachyglossus aculeatus]|uniref:V-set and immunoglobulin domain-containing protein 1 n=1 Tax=Tachyglossus aculeatus TaxID=9261 RepID=UPI0018F3A749|nr:V-set and immunoglobulin domain-containing protein 1 [Tachyglossus aculeatus]
MFPVILKMFAILASLSGSVTAVQVTVPVSVVNVTVGASATLLCTFTSTLPLSDAVIQWSFHHSSELQYATVYYSQHGQSYSIGEFKDRVVASSVPGNASITITNLQPSDTGVFICDVTNSPDFEGSNQGSVLVNVLVKPSPPFCHVGGKTETGHLISLTCFSAVGKPRPQYLWYKIDTGTLIPIQERYNPRSGILVIGNLTDFEEGYYRCIATNSLGNASCEIDLTSGHSDADIIAGALIGAVLGALLICLVVWFVMTKIASKRRKEKVTAERRSMTRELPTSVYEAVPVGEVAPITATQVTGSPKNSVHNTDEVEGEEESEVVPDTAGESLQ